MNPMPGATGLRLNVSEADNALDLELARSVATIFRVRDANSVIDRFVTTVAQWRTVAAALKFSKRELELVEPAFALAG